MAIDYQMFIGSYYRFNVQGKSIETLVEDAFNVFRNYKFITEHKEFYAKNLFNEEVKSLYFFTENQFIEVGIDLENVSLEAIDYKKVTNVKMKFFSHNHYALGMKLDDGREIILDNQIDTNTHHSFSFIKKINNIHTILVGNI